MLNVIQYFNDHLMRNKGNKRENEMLLTVLVFHLFFQQPEPPEPRS